MTANEIICAYMAAQEQKRIAEKKAEEMKNLLLSMMGSAPIFETDSFTVISKRTESVRLDTKALYSDFPDIKKDYGRPSVSVSLTIAEKAVSAGLKTA